MPPHCDAMDGPVVMAAKRALETGDVTVALPFVHEGGEEEVRRAFEKAFAGGKQGQSAKEVADLYFFETVVRVHRAGEGAPYTGLKPAGLDHGPVIPIAERAIETGSPDELIRLLSDAVQREVKERFDRVMELQARTGKGLREAREYAETMLGLQVWSNKLYGCLRADPHEAHGAYEQHAD